jgi:hypothetical protein
MKALLIGAAASYLVTWCSGIYIARQTSMDRIKARRIHLGLSLVTCTVLTAYVLLVLFR